MILTTTHSIEGKEIKEYLGLVTGTDIYLVGGLFGGGMSNQERLFGTAYKSACGKLSEKATALGADAVVGINVTVSSPGTTGHIIVTVTGTAVSTGERDDIPEI